MLERFEHLSELINTKVDELVARLTQATYVHISQEATQKLHSRKDQFFDNFPAPDQLDYHTWEIKILGKEDGKNGGAVWIDEGLNSGFDLLPGFLNSPKAKQGKNGKYLVIPFKHNKGPSKQTQLQQILTNTIKQELAKKSIPYGNLENGPNGPKIGRLHRMDINRPEQQNKVPVGHIGPEGRPFQVNPRPAGQLGPGGRPYLNGLTIYQKEKTNPAGHTVVQKDIMTFRTASESQAGRKWIHPGLTPMKFLDDGALWASSEWDQNLLPELIKELENEK